jgi:hypothetical protein
MAKGSENVRTDAGMIGGIFGGFIEISEGS